MNRFVLKSLKSLITSDLTELGTLTTIMSGPDLSYEFCKQDLAVQVSGSPDTEPFR